MKKLLLSLGLMSLLSGCSYNAKIGCWSILQNGCGPTGPSDFDSYRKDGETKEQKTQDVIDCGGIMDSKGYIFNYIRDNASKNMQNEDIDKQDNAENNAVRKFDVCMKNKGYKFDSTRPAKHS